MYKRQEEAPAPEALPAADSFEEHKGAAGWTDVSSAQEWSAALDGIGTAGSTICQIRLTGSFALPDMLTIAQGNTLELDLNGQTLTAAQGKRHLAVSGSLTLTDSGSGGVPVAYTHLDVYKRQAQAEGLAGVSLSAGTAGDTEATAEAYGPLVLYYKADDMTISPFPRCV